MNSLSAAITVSQMVGPRASLGVAGIFLGGVLDILKSQRVSTSTKVRHSLKTLRQLFLDPQEACNNPQHYQNAHPK